MGVISTNAMAFSAIWTVVFGLFAWEVYTDRTTYVPTAPPQVYRFARDRYQNARSGHICEPAPATSATFTDPGCQPGPDCRWPQCLETFPYAFTEHMWTSHEPEMEELIKEGWVKEGIAW